MTHTPAHTNTDVLVILVCSAIVLLLLFLSLLLPLLLPNRKMLKMCGETEEKLAQELIQFENQIERDVVEPLYVLAEVRQEQGCAFGMIRVFFLNKKPDTFSELCCSCAIVIIQQCRCHFSSYIIEVHGVRNQRDQHL